MGQTSLFLLQRGGWDRGWSGGRLQGEIAFGHAIAAVDYGGRGSRTDNKGRCNWSKDAVLGRGSTGQSALFRERLKEKKLGERERENSSQQSK